MVRARYERDRACYICTKLHAFVSRVSVPLCTECETRFIPKPKPPPVPAVNPWDTREDTQPIPPIPGFTWDLSG